VQEAPELSLVIVPWTKEHDASQFTSNLESIEKYIQEHVHRDVSSYTSSVFVLTEPCDMLIRGYYSLSVGGGQIAHKDGGKNYSRRKRKGCR